MIIRLFLSALLFVSLSRATTADFEAPVEVVMWAGGTWAGLSGQGGTFALPNYLGHAVERRKCSLPCTFTADRTRAPMADALLFEAQPLAGYDETYLREPFSLPQRRVAQSWINMAYEHGEYFHLYRDTRWTELIQLNATFDHKHSQVPISFVCFWGGGADGNAITPETFLAAPFSFDRPRSIAFMATNCGMGGADARTEYVRELMRHIHVDSLGQCLHNTDVPEEMQFPIYSDHGSSMRNKIQLFSQYKFVLAFENNNFTDYVTEKLINALQSGALPIYMGAGNVDEWIPSPDAILRTDQFSSPAALAAEIKRLSNDRSAYEAHFAWRKRPWSDAFRTKLSECAFYGTDCRLCDAVRRLRASKRTAEVERINALPPLAMVADGNGYLQVESSPECLSNLDTLTIAAWIYPKRFGDGLRIVDKNIAGQIAGFNFDLLQNAERPDRANLRLCGAGACRLGVRSLLADSHWYHVALTFERGAARLAFYVNGRLDAAHVVLEPLQANALPLLLGAGVTAERRVVGQWAGKLQDVSVWSRALGAGELRRLAHRRVAADEPGLEFALVGGENVARARRCGQPSVVGRVEWEPSERKPFLANPYF